MKTEMLGIILKSLFYAAVLLILFVLAKSAKHYLDAKTAKVKETARLALVNYAVRRTDDVIGCTISRMKAKMSAKETPGALSQDEIKAIKTKTLQNTEKLLSGDICDILIMEFGDADLYLKSKIDTAFETLK